jgi:hypothetical protein
MRHVGAVAFLLLGLQSCTRATEEAGSCKSFEVMMYCVEHTFIAKSFKHKTSFQQAQMHCINFLPRATRSCQIAEKDLHDLFSNAASKTGYMRERKAMLDKCHKCVAEGSNGLVAGPPTPAPTPVSDFVGECEKRCAKIVNKKYSTRVFSELCESSAGDVCSFVTKKEGGLPHAFVKSTAMGDAFLNRRHDACFCMRHCSAEQPITLKCAQQQSNAEAVVISAAMEDATRHQVRHGSTALNGATAQ